MAHPLIRDTARELPVQPEFEIEPRVERTVGLAHQKPIPIGVLFADLLYLGTPPPAWTVIVPHHLHLAHASQRARYDGFLSGILVCLAAMLGTHLHHYATLPNRVARRLGLFQH